MSAASRIHVHDIPPEILCRIFHLAAIMEPLGCWKHPSDSYESSARRKLGWSKVTYVCRYWREVALLHPSFWTSLQLGLGEKWLTELVSRAQSMPYTINSQFISEHNSGLAVTALENYLHDLVRLGLKGLVAPVGWALIHASPLLEDLRLSTSNYLYTHIIPLPDNLFDDNAPRLRRISLYGCCLPWNSPVPSLSVMDPCLRDSLSGGLQFGGLLPWAFMKRQRDGVAMQRIYSNSTDAHEVEKINKALRTYFSRKNRRTIRMTEFSLQIILPLGLPNTGNTGQSCAGAVIERAEWRFSTSSRSDQESSSMDARRDCTLGAQAFLPEDDLDIDTTTELRASYRLHYG